MQRRGHKNVVVYSFNANIHVYVRDDFNEIYLYNVKDTVSPDFEVFFHLRY